jgi:hypothetical protein
MGANASVQATKVTFPNQFTSMAGNLIGAAVAKLEEFFGRSL